jgi:hypothetical protein
VKSRKANRLLNLTIFITIYCLLLLSFFDNEPSFQRGASRGLAVGIPLVLLLVVILTAFYTLRRGGGWSMTLRNLIHNFSGMLDFTILIGRKNRH